MPWTIPLTLGGSGPAVALPFFEVNGYYYDIESPLTGGTTNAAQVLGITGAQVTFTPRLPEGFSILVNDSDLLIGDSYGSSISVAPITGQITVVESGWAGTLVTQNGNNTSGVSLLANSGSISSYLSSQGISQLIYDVSFELVEFAGAFQYISNFAFVAPTSNTPVCITDPNLATLPYVAS